MILAILADDNMRGDRVGDHGPAAGFIALIVIGLFFYVLLDGPFRRGGGKK